MKGEFFASIGIECHVQLKTISKLFSATCNDARTAPANSLISHIDMGLPGALPVLNKRAVELAIRASAALNATPEQYSQFDRKHYFYPDLPMGYQITQFYHPIIKSGFVGIIDEGKSIKIRVKEAHLEADAGKSLHPGGSDFSYVDLNRAGTPLLEIVSEPDIKSSKQARLYARELWLLMKYADVSEADLYQGNMRFDVNVSVSDSNELGTRSETKNLNSFKSVEKAVDYEIRRQTELIKRGNKVVQETRGWDEAKQKTFSQRSKEEAHDYRYMPDPDLPPVNLTSTVIKTALTPAIKNPDDIRRALAKCLVPKAVIENLIEETVLGDFLTQLINEPELPPAGIKKIADWLSSDVQAYKVSHSLDWEKFKLSVANFSSLYSLFSAGKINSTSAKSILLKMIVNGKKPVDISSSENLYQLSDEDNVKDSVSQVLKNNLIAVEDVRSGEKKAIGYLVGQVMALSKGKANPVVAAKLIQEAINDKSS